MLWWQVGLWKGGCKLDFRFNKEEEAFRQEIRKFVEKELDSKITEEFESGVYNGKHTWDFVRKLGRKRWLVPSWPGKYGGLGAPFTYTYILREEIARKQELPPLYGAYTAGPTILLYGNEEQKSFYLPGIASGEIEFAIGYSEPEAGSDLAAVKLRATETTDGYILDGQKLFSSGAHYAQYHLILARTDPDAPKHEGLSVFIADLKSRGITQDPIYCLGATKTNSVYYDSVFVPKSNLLGEKNRGWTYIRAALDYERASMHSVTGLDAAFNELIRYVRQMEHNNKPVYTMPTIRDRLARLAVEIEVVRMFSYRIVWLQSAGLIPTYESDMLKLFQTETLQHLYSMAMEILGLYGILDRRDEGAPLGGHFQNLYQRSMLETVAGGSSEIERSVIARRGYKLPKD
jgi:alkylation response protein AidB-like acyl-CoA dehydrogenase